MNTWLTEGNQLLLELNDSTKYYPSAEQIYKVSFQNYRELDGYTVNNPKDQLKDISFSKYPLELRLLLHIKDREIYLDCLAYNKNFEVIIETLTNKADHIINENTWYPFIGGSIDYISETLDKIGVKTLGKIKLSEYLKIKTVLNDPDLLEDKVEAFNMLYKTNNFKAPTLLNGVLYDYQKDGYKWLTMMTNEGLGGILADEMGLGKTVQLIALLTKEVGNIGNPSLIICPSTIIENWRREIIKFTREMKILIHHGNTRTGYYKELLNYDVIITSFDTVIRDESMFGMLDFNLVIVDEAQAIKNPIAQRTRSIKKLKRRVSIAVTGTPLENSITDLWSLVDFIIPNYLGSLKQFEEIYKNDPESASKLEPLVSPIMLRRRVSEVAKDLPERIDIPQAIKISNWEAEMYENIREKTVEEYGDYSTLVSLMKLRRFCTHPMIMNELNLTSKDIYTNKYQRLIEILEEALKDENKILIFTSYSRMIDLLMEDLSLRYCLKCSFIDGRIDVNDRQSIVDSFSNDDAQRILILNPRAAGTGLNITAANHVIHYNLEWNPAIEDQASARAYRRGQSKPVKVHRLYYANTVEEIINHRVELKRNIADSAVVGVSSENEIAQIVSALKISPFKVNKINYI